MKENFKEINITPRDVLFFNDAKAIAGSADGNGATFPLPSVLYSSILSSLHINYDDEINALESKHASKRINNNGSEKKTQGSLHFGGLQTIGPFPKINNEIYFPTPADLLAGENDNKSAGILELLDVKKITEGEEKSSGILDLLYVKKIESDLPKPLKYFPVSNVKPTKKTVGEYISSSELKKYLEGEKIVTTKKFSDLFSTEGRPGIEINADNLATVDTKFYSAEYLRLKKDVRLAAFIHCEAKKSLKNSNNINSNIDLIEKFFVDKNDSFIFGGQRGLAFIEKDNKAGSYEANLKLADEKITTKVKWILLSPAYFAKGFIPGFIDSETGEVKLQEKSENIQRKPNEQREEWRKRMNANKSEIKAKLVAAKVNKPLVYSGWKLDIEGKSNGKPKATKLLVPAGSVYYFECENQNEAKKLINSLHLQVKSDYMGEQGFAFGVCSNWQEQK